VPHSTQTIRRTLFCKTACDCGWSKIGSFDSDQAAIQWADEMASAHLADEEYCISPWAEVTFTVRLPLYGRLRRPSTEREMRALLRGDPCAYCGAKCEQLDHITPRARGGGDLVDNLTAACAPCNRRKRTRPLLHFLVSL
jgi:hypothetical protein